MGDQPNHRDVQHTPDVKAEVRADLSEYIRAEKTTGRDSASTKTTGERLRDAAVAFEDTLGQDQHVADLAKAIKDGTPGTPEWDKLMEQVAKQLDGNNQKIGSVRDGMAQTSKDLVAANTQISSSPYINNSFSINHQA